MYSKKQPDSNDPVTRLIENRRSIRSYKQNLPPKEWIAQMINCAGWAPSPSNRQPVQFVLIASEEKKTELKKALEQGKDHLLCLVDEKKCSRKLKNWIRHYFRYSSFMFDAPWLFGAGILNEKEGFAARLAGGGLIDGSTPSDEDDQIALGMALNNFVLKGSQLGLGTCILTAPILFLKHSSQWPVFSQLHLKNFITVGFPNEDPVAPSRKPMSDIFRVI